jgi:hypothetical protein
MSTLRLRRDAIEWREVDGEVVVLVAVASSAWASTAHRPDART